MSTRCWWAGTFRSRNHDNMPATFLSHQALVLPLKMRWPHRFSGLALVFGSMAPDLEFIGTMRDDWIFSHTIGAQLWFTVPVSMLLVWLASVVVIPAILPYVRDHPEWRLHDLAALGPPRGWRGWSSVAVSAWIGGMSHILLDGVTHGNHSGWLVPFLPFLRMPVPHPGGVVPLHDALQLWLTLLLGLATLIMWRSIARRRLLWRWRGRAMVTLPRQRQTAGRQLVWVCLAAAVQGGIAGSLLRSGEADKLVAAGVGFGAVDFTCLAVVVSALAIRRRHRARDGNHRAPNGTALTDAFRVAGR